MNLNPTHLDSQQASMKPKQRKAHQHKEADYCVCSELALEPDEDCPVHGHPSVRRCEICGQFMSWAEQVRKEIDGQC